MTELTRCLLQARNKQRLSQGEVARRAGIDKTDVIRLESGLFAALDTDALCRLAATLSVNEELFLTLYGSSFAREKKLLRENIPSGEHSVPVLGPELTAIVKNIMSLPEEPRRNMIHTIRLLLQAQYFQIHTASQ